MRTYFEHNSIEIATENFALINLPNENLNQLSCCHYFSNGTHRLIQCHLDFVWFRPTVFRSNQYNDWNKFQIVHTLDQHSTHCSCWCMLSNFVVHWNYYSYGIFPGSYTGLSTNTHSMWATQFWRFQQMTLNIRIPSDYRCWQDKQSILFIQSTLRKNHTYSRSAVTITNKNSSDPLSLKHAVHAEWTYVRKLIKHHCGFPICSSIRHFRGHYLKSNQKSK